MAPQLKLALLLLVFDGVEESQVVGGPDDGADAFDFAGEGFAGREIFDMQRVLAEAGGVGCVGEPTAVVGDVGVADGEEGVPLGELVAVEQHFFRRRHSGRARARLPRLAAVDGVLQAFLGTGVVPPRAIAIGNRDIGLLDVREHLLVEVLAQAVERRHDGFGVGVFGVEISGDFRIFLVAQPGVIVREDDAV